MSQQGAPQPGFNPHAVGAAPGGQPDPSTRLFGLLPDANVGQGLALNNLGPLKGNIPVSVFQDKGPRTLGKLSGALGIRNRVEFSGAIVSLMDGVENATREQVHGAGMSLAGNGVSHMGFAPESALGELNPPSTPGLGRSAERGLG